MATGFKGLLALLLRWPAGYPEQIQPDEGIGFVGDRAPPGFIGISRGDGWNTERRAAGWNAPEVLDI